MRIGPHEGHHIEFALYALMAILLLYRPPRASSGIVNTLRGFIENHFGDSIGMYLLHLGILLIIVGSVWPEMTQVGQMGQSLVVAAMGVLKLKQAPPPETTTVSTATTTSVTPPSTEKTA